MSCSRATQSMTPDPNETERGSGQLRSRMIVLGRPSRSLFQRVPKLSADAFTSERDGYSSVGRTFSSQRPTHECGTMARLGWSESLPQREVVMITGQVVEGKPCIHLVHEELVVRQGRDRHPHGL